MPLARRPIVQLQGDLRLRAVGHPFRNFRLAAARGIASPAFRQEQLAIEQTVKIVGGIGQMHSNDPVFLLAHRAQVLPLHAGSLVPLFHEAGFIDDANGMGMGMFRGNDLLQAVASQIFLPTMLAEKLLQRSHRHVGRQGDWLDALAGQIRELAVDIDREMCPRVFACKAVVEAFQKTGKHRSQSANLLGIHAWASLTGQDASFATLPKQGNINLAL